MDIGRRRFLAALPAIGSVIPARLGFLFPTGEGENIVAGAPGLTPGKTWSSTSCTTACFP
jgi:hypothetical protein